MTDTTREKKVISEKKKYLVKWTGRPYSECTWELAADIGDEKNWHLPAQSFPSLTREVEDNARTALPEVQPASARRAAEIRSAGRPASPAPMRT